MDNIGHLCYLSDNFVSNFVTNAYVEHGTFYVFLSLRLFRSVTPNNYFFLSRRKNTNLMQLAQVCTM